MTMKQIVIRVRELEAEVATLKRRYIGAPHRESVDTANRKRVQAVLASTAGVWKKAKLDSVAWQRKVRKTSPSRLKSLSV